MEILYLGSNEKKKIQIEARQREVENECFENKATKC